MDGYLVAVDSGGTFCDCVVVDAAGTLFTGKAPSTPPDFATGILDAVRITAQSMGTTADGAVDHPATRAQRDAIRAARLGGHAKKPDGKDGGGCYPGEASSTGDADVKVLNEYVRIRPHDGAAWLQCRCGRLLCRSADNLKEHVHAGEVPIQHAGPLAVPIAVAVSHRFVWREFHCPGCGLLLNAEVALRGEPYLFDAQIF